MANKIELQFPYTQDYKSGYLVTNKQKRTHVILVKLDKTNSRLTSTAYARYLLAVKIGRYLTKDETADHIDNDKTNDIADNLQILSRDKNLRKYHSTTKGGMMIEAICSICDKIFTRPRNQSSLVLPLRKDRCSKACTEIAKSKGDKTPGKILRVFSAR